MAFLIERFPAPIHRVVPISPGAYPQGRYAKYSEAGPDYIDNMQRLLQKFETAKGWCRSPSYSIRATGAGKVKGCARIGDLFRFDIAGHEGGARRSWKTTASLGALRVRAFPFADAVREFIAEYGAVFVIEQNRDAQMRALLINELGIDPARLVPMLHYDGTPITARFIHEMISARINRAKVTPIKKVA